jgi:photosystem II stability/assembly factor-like uncharacterized protein
MLRVFLMSGVFVMFHCQIVYTQWFRATGLTSNTVEQIVSVSGMHFAVTSSAGIFRSTDNGMNWVAANNGLNNFFINYLHAHGNVLFVGVGIYQGGDIYRSTNLGESWTRVPLNGVSPHPAVFSFASRSNYVFASTEAAGVFRTSNLGGTWIAASIGLPGTTYIGAMLGIEGRVLANDGGTMYETTDDGVSWHNAPLTSTIRQFLNPGGTTIYVANLNGWLTGGGGVRRSEDFCRTWTFLGLRDTSVHSIAIRGSDIFASTDNGVFRRETNGSSWTNVSFGLLNRTTYAIAVSDSFLIAGTLYEGIWLRPLNEVVSFVTGGKERPSLFELFQNYPNPFNPSTTIEFELPKSTRVTLKIFDLLGREVATLVDENLAAGVHKSEWNASDFSSGVYFYRLQAGEFSATKKLVLLR